MKTRLLFLIPIVMLVLPTFGQNDKGPGDLTEAIAMLQTDCPDSLKILIKKTGDDSLVRLCYPWDGDYKTVYDWTVNEDKETKISKYLVKNGIAVGEHQQAVILIAFKKTLLGESVDENTLFLPYQIIERKWAKEDSVRFTTDSLRGVYIPIDLQDCFKQIDLFWNDTVKEMVRNMTEGEFCGKAHFGFGMWMRNNWQLWGGSRLSKFFNELGVFHPDDMSGIILTSYHRHLTGVEIKLEEQLGIYKEFWEKEKKGRPEK